MPKAYSNDLRLRAVAAMQGGETCRAVAAGFDIAPSTAVKWFRRFKQSGSTAPAKIGGYLAPVGCVQDLLQKAGCQEAAAMACPMTNRLLKKPHPKEVLRTRRIQMLHLILRLRTRNPRSSGGNLMSMMCQ